MTQSEINSIKVDLKLFMEDNPNLNNTKLAEKFIDEDEGYNTNY